MENLLLKAALLDSCLRCHCLEAVLVYVRPVAKLELLEQNRPSSQTLGQTVSQGEGLLPKRTTILGNGRVHRL